MAKLYEIFISDFYKYYQRNDEVTVQAPKLNCNLNYEISKENLLLPEMRTDILWKVIKRKGKCY
ncbi:hypothetical protein EDC18_103205 [Natranaerovirga pectinivora]|uniref:Uncharacterized protein n=1 Tax=Natranaerovirga pectinivora TaxID=682400 RepID=A0A4V6NZU1_9FIRM|nr:hypothetical protein [Natranaerovirga pectinivora]TCT15500.1 hypothetical protein EDC18_103205 [Natranaerovirga pectinivora]